MFTRISSLAVLAAALVACQPSPNQKPGNVGKSSTIACAVGGASDFANSCEMERVRRDGHDVLVVRHPDGSFRRFDVLADGAGFAAADGAEPAEARYGTDHAELAVGRDRYRFPITLKAPSQAHAAKP